MRACVGFLSKKPCLDTCIVHPPGLLVKFCLFILVGWFLNKRRNKTTSQRAVGVSLNQ